MDEVAETFPIETLLPARVRGWRQVGVVAPFGNLQAEAPAVGVEEVAGMADENELKAFGNEIAETPGAFVEGTPELEATWSCSARSRACRTTWRRR